MSSRVTPEPGPRQIPDFGFRFFEDSCMSPRVTPELSPRQTPELAIFRSSRHCQLEIPGFRMFVTPPLHRTMIPEFYAFANPSLHRSQASENREFPVPEKTCLKNFVRLNVSRVTGFPEFPNKYIIIIFTFAQIFLNKTNGQMCSVKVKGCKYFGTEGVRMITDFVPASKLANTNFFWQNNLG
jgi:hypothetical protein